MYDDAHADWGHRDNILRESHRAVNIGIASNGRRTTFIQHFEGGAIEADGPLGPQFRTACCLFRSPNERRESQSEES